MASDSKTSDRTRSSRIANFFRLSVAERVQALAESGFLADADIQLLASGGHTLDLNAADKMIENVIGVFGLPVGVGLNFLINGSDYIVPLAVEEPSIVAGLSGTARRARTDGGFFFETTEPLLIGQIQAVGIDDPEQARHNLLQKRQAILERANRLHQRMVERGGGARDVEVHLHKSPNAGSPANTMLVVHLVVDTQEAMGANLVNAMCEDVAPLVEEITGGRVFLRILSNLTDRSMVHARVRFSETELADKHYSGAEVRDGIVLANDFALADPYRAATHNKGIMNGIDAIAIATGQDWRAIEAAAHAYAARSGRYAGLTEWQADAEGGLVGRLSIPMKVGTVGGALKTNPTVRIAHKLLGEPSASELAGVIGVVGLAQNFAALRSLATSGIQSNHMNLHARSVASAANVPEVMFEEVVERLIESGEIREWKAAEIVEELTARATSAPQKTPIARAAGKVILFGEHSAVYGFPAIAVPIDNAMQASIEDNTTDQRLVVADWSIDEAITQSTHPVLAELNGVLGELLPTEHPFTIHVEAAIPAGMGLGGSAALAVVALRAVNNHFKIGLNDDQINRYAFRLEQAAHGNPSGVDNTVATYGKALIFQQEKPLQTLSLGAPLDLVVGLSHQPGATAQTVAHVRTLLQTNAAVFQPILDAIGAATSQAQQALGDGDLDTVGHLMNACQGMLNALQLSTPQLEDMIHTARQAGATGAKLTGGGGGGSMVALAPGCQAEVSAALEASGYATLALTLS